MAAGDWARAVYANDDAIRHYERALRTLADCQACDDQVRAVRERLADLLALTGRRAEALAHYEAVRQELEAAADRAGAARLHRKIGGLHWEAGDRERASACFASGLERLGRGRQPDRARAAVPGDGPACVSGRRQRRRHRVGRAGARRSGEREDDHARSRARARGGGNAGAGLQHAGRGACAHRPPRARRSTRSSRASSWPSTHDLLQAACRGYTNLGVLYSSLDPRRSIETCLRGLETAKKVGDLGFQSRLYANLAVAYCALTDRCEAEGIEAAQTAIDLDRRLGLLDHLAVPLIVFGQIHQCHGDHALAFASYEEALALAERVGEPQLLFPCYDGLATLYLDAGDQAMAEVYLAKSQEVCERAGLEPDALMVLPFLC